jgi:hypothetical protein
MDAFHRIFRLSDRNIGLPRRAAEDAILDSAAPWLLVRTGSDTREALRLADVQWDSGLL